MNPLILGHLTVLDQDPPSVIGIAAAVGFAQIGLRLLASRPNAISYPLAKNPSMLRETLSRMNDAGITVFDVDVVRLTPETDVASLEPLMEVAGRLGAKSVLVTAGDPDRSRFMTKLEAFCRLAAPYGLAADLEFMLFTPTVPDLPTALGVTEEVGCDNLGVLVDTIHFDRTRAAPALLRTIPRHRLNYVHLTDARAERPTQMDALMEDSRAYRMHPGDGHLDLPAMIRNLPSDLPLCIEVSNAELDATSPALERASRAYAGTRRLLAQTANMDRH